MAASRAESAARDPTASHEHEHEQTVLRPEIDHRSSVRREHHALLTTEETGVSLAGGDERAHCGLWRGWLISFAEHRDQDLGDARHVHGRQA